MAASLVDKDSVTADSFVAYTHAVVVGGGVGRGRRLQITAMQTVSFVCMCAHTSDDCCSEYPLHQLVLSKCSDSPFTTGGIDCKTLQQYLHAHRQTAE